MRKNLIQICAMGVLAMMSVSARAEDPKDLETKKSIIALSVGAAAAVPPVAGTIHNYKKAKELSEEGMSLVTFMDKSRRSRLLKEEEAATTLYKRGMVLSVLVPATAIVATMNLLGLKQSDAKVAQQVEKAKAVQQGGGDVPQAVRTPAANASAF